MAIQSRSWAVYRRSRVILRLLLWDESADRMEVLTAFCYGTLFVLQLCRRIEFVLVLSGCLDGLTASDNITHEESLLNKRNEML